MMGHGPTWGVMAALPEELGDLIHRLESVATQNVAGRDFVSGQLNDNHVVAVTARIGKVAAALTASTLIERFGVDRLVFIGVAGGLGAQVRRGDVVVATELVQHDLSAWPLFPDGEIPLLGKTRLSTDTRLTQALLTAAQQALGPGQILHQGLIASGDRFIQGHAAAHAIRSRYPDVLAVEMEGAAVAQVCTECSVPFGVLRTLSDVADDTAAHDFLAFMRDTAAPLASRVLGQLFQP